MVENAIDSAPMHIPAPSSSDLFLTFARMGLSGFGGVLPWARRILVDDRGWLTPEEFNEALALCQFLPGPNIVNFSVAFGSRVRGVPGAIAALAGLLLPPVAIVLVVGVLYARFGDSEVLRHVLTGLAAAAAGLIIAVAAKMAKPLLRGSSWPGTLIALAALLAVGLMGWPLAVVLLGLAPTSVALSWWLGR